VLLFSKVLQSVGIADVGYALYMGVARNDMWNELYMSLAGVGIFYLGRLIESRS
jgi:hypothetical protein